MRKEIILPTLAVTGGIAGFAIRKGALASGAFAVVPLTVLTLVVAALLLLLGRTGKVSFSGYDRAFAARGSTLYITAMVCAAFLTAIAGVLFLLGLPQALAEAKAARGGVPYLAVAPKAVLGVLALAAAWGLFTTGRNNYRSEGGGAHSTAVLFPSYACCLWLIVTYQSCSGDPILLHYVWEVLSIVAAVLGTYYLAGFAFGRGRLLRSTLWSFLAVTLGLIALANTPGPAYILLYAGILLYLLASASLLHLNCRKPRASAEDTITNREETPHEG